MRAILFSAAIAALAAGCEAGEGTLEVRIYGEELIEEGIPAEVFNDGWSVAFTRFLVVVDEIATDDADGSGRYAFDLTEASGGEGHELIALTALEGEQALAYRIAPGDTATAGNAPEADAAMMSAMGYSLFVEGAATKDGTTVGFAWGFDSSTSYSDCAVVDAVRADATTTTVITIHADHILYDDLESMTPNTSFDLIAASDLDADGTVTREELLARDITAEARYQVGSTGIENLWDYMSALSRTVGHIDGEGECKT